ncbi:MAG: efflux RND transporter periplasmic adaptor subunit [Ignavibacteriales bacterium]|nr:MAG: efflux RND transporter periplasmic adaptor subunit [Ignavibacteriales bacterium]
MNKRIFVLLSLTLLAFAGCSQKEEETTEKSVPVKIYQVKSESISKYIRATGTITGDEDVILYSKVAERIEKINFVPGQSVAKDQILLVQKNDILKQGLDIASASLKTAEAQSKLATIEFDRLSKLHSEKAISPQQFDQSKTAKETAEHAFEQAKSMYEQAKEQYENSFVKAPFGGVVAAVYVEKNQTINIGQQVIQIISPSKMKSKIYLTGEDVQNVRNGQKVQIKFPTIPNQVFEGRVDKINAAIDQVSKSLEVEIVLISKESRIKSGIFGEFFIETEKNINSLVIPEVALIPQTEIKIDRQTGLQNTFKKYYVFVLENKKAKMKEVKTGIANNGQIEITEGLNTGESVIIIGQNIVKEGQNVNVIE